MFLQPFPKLVDLNSQITELGR